MIEIGETPKNKRHRWSWFRGHISRDRLMEEGILFEILDLTESQKYPEQTKICDVRDKIDRSTASQAMLLSTWRQYIETMSPIRMLITERTYWVQLMSLRYVKRKKLRN